MSELRKDPITREWVCIATERAKRRSDFIQTSDRTQDHRAQSAACPFCPGNEHPNPADILLLLPHDSGAVRVVTEAVRSTPHAARASSIKNAAMCSSDTTVTPPGNDSVLVR